VVSWATTHFFLIQSIIHEWYTKATVERELYMEIPKGITMTGSHADRSKYALSLVNNLYGQHQAGQVWYQYLTQGLI
jgi:hypothetical protein